MQWSKYQNGIFDFIGDNHYEQNGTVNAVAGSGKTTVLVEAAKRIKGGGTFFAFNKHIADELGRPT